MSATAPPYRLVVIVAAVVTAVVKSLPGIKRYQKTQVVGAHLGYADTPLIAHLTDVDKSDPALIVSRILDALERGDDEAIADDVSRQVQSILPGITTGILPQ